jgi:uncharacterized protein
MRVARRWRDPDGRLAPTLRVALYLPAFILIAIAVSISTTLLVQPAMLGGGASAMGSAAGLLVGGLASAVSAALSTWLFRRFVDRRSWSDLGLQRGRGSARELASGFGLGTLLMAGIAVIEIALGWYRFEGVAPVGEATARLVVGLIAFAAVAFGEELVVRGYILQTLTEGWGTIPAAVTSSLVFGLLHLGNPNSGPIAVAGITVAGLLLAATYYRTARLWMPIGFHWSWNLFQGPVFGFPVSGAETGGLLTLSPSGPVALTGGPFGPEASLVGVAACLVGIALLRPWSRP